MVNRKVIIKIVILTGLTLTNIYFFKGMGITKTIEEKKLYVYSIKEFLSFLKKIGYRDYSINNSFNITRNSVGTELRFFNEKRKTLIVSCEGLIKEVEIPSNKVWLDDRYQTLAWYDAKTDQVNYKDGTIGKPPFMIDKRADPSGVYFLRVKSIINKDEVNSTAIYSIDAPQEILFEINNFFGKRIFSKNNRVYVFGDFYIERDLQTDLYIFERNGNSLHQLEKIIIPRPLKSPAPFVLEDFDPSGGEALFTDTHDFGRADLYIYNLKTHELKRIGKEPFGGGYGFYLQCDIIKRVMEKNKE